MNSSFRPATFPKLTLICYCHYSLLETCLIKNLSCSCLIRDASQCRPKTHRHDSSLLNGFTFDSTQWQSRALISLSSIISSRTGCHCELAPYVWPSVYFFQNDENYRHHPQQIGLHISEDIVVVSQANTVSQAATCLFVSHLRLEGRTARGSCRPRSRRGHLPPQSCC